MSARVPQDCLDMNTVKSNNPNPTHSEINQSGFARKCFSSRAAFSASPELYYYKTNIQLLISNCFTTRPQQTNLCFYEAKAKSEQSRAEQSNAKQRKATQSKAKLSKAYPEDSFGISIKFERSTAKQRKANQSKTKKNKAKQSKAKQCKANQTKAKQTISGR